jgi:hypothetical protein
MGSEHGVSLDHASGAGIESGLVQRVRHLSNQPLRDVAREPRVGVERDHVANAGRNDGRLTGLAQVGRVRVAAQQSVELVQLAAFALPPDPFAFAFIPDASAMEQEEALAIRRRFVAEVEARDSRACRREQLVVAWRDLGDGVCPVREQSEADVATRSRQVMHFESLDLLLDFRAGREERGHHDQRAQARRHAGAQIEAGKRLRRELIRNDPVHQHDCRIRCGDQREQREHEQRGSRRRGSRGTQQRRGEQQCRDECNRSEITEDSCGGGRAYEPATQRRAESELALECRAPARDQVIARVLLASRRRVTGLGRPGPGALRRLDRAPGDVDLGVPRAAREIFDRVAVTIARRELHRGEVALGAQRLVDETHALEEVRPIDLGQQPHAHDHVANRHVRRALQLMLFADDLVGRRSLTGESFVEPAQCWRHGGILVAKPLDELHRERTRQARRFEGPQHDGDRLRLATADSEESIRRAVGGLPSRTTGRDPFGRAPKVLDEEDPQRDRDRPELADRQRLDALVGTHETEERSGVEVAVRVRDERPGQTENTREPGERTFCELRQQAIEAARQVVVNLANLLFDDVEVVDQPLGGRRDRPLLSNRVANRPIGGEQHPAVVAKPLCERSATGGPARDALRSREALRMLLEAFDAEEFGADRIFAVRTRMRPQIPERSKEVAPIPHARPVRRCARRSCLCVQTARRSPQSTQ